MVSLFFGFWAVSLLLNHPTCAVKSSLLPLNAVTSSECVLSLLSQRKSPAGEGTHLLGSFQIILLHEDLHE